MPYKDKAKQREYNRIWMMERRLSWLSKNGPCSKCESWSDLCIHHVDPSKKESHCVWSWSKRRREKELKKCVVLCKICHITLHADQLKTDVHGTSMYGRGCRCNECKKAHRLYQRKYRQRIKNGN